jgi:hypothetical protein
LSRPKQGHTAEGWLKWQPTPYVFTTELGDPSDPRALRALKAAAKRAGLPFLCRAAHTAALCCFRDVVRWRAAQGGIGGLRSRMRCDHRRHLAKDEVGQGRVCRGQIPPISTMANLTGRTITALQQQFSVHLRPRHGHLWSTTTRGSPARMRSIPAERRERPASASHGHALCARPCALCCRSTTCARRRRGLGGMRPGLERVDRLRRAGHCDMGGIASTAEPQRQLERLAGQRHAVTRLRDTAFALRGREAHADR